MSWQLALDVIQDVRGSVAMYLFIIEEAIQTVMMAVYIANKAGQYEKMIELATYVKNEVIEPAILFNNTYGAVAYPLNMSYDVFYKSAKRTTETYLELTAPTPP